MGKQYVIGGRDNAEVYGRLSDLCADVGNEGALVFVHDWQPRSNVQTYANGSYANTRVYRITRAKQKGAGVCDYEVVDGVEGLGGGVHYSAATQTLEVGGERVFLPSATTERAGLLDGLTLQKIANNQRALSYAALGGLPRIRRATDAEVANMVLVYDGVEVGNVVSSSVVSGGASVLTYANEPKGKERAFAYGSDAYADWRPWEKNRVYVTHYDILNARLAGRRCMLVFEARLSYPAEMSEEELLAAGYDRHSLRSRVRFMRSRHNAEDYVETELSHAWRKVGVEVSLLDSREEGGMQYGEAGMGAFFFAPWVQDYISEARVQVRNLVLYDVSSGTLPLGAPLGVITSSLSYRNYVLDTLGAVRIGSGGRHRYALSSALEARMPADLLAFVHGDVKKWRVYVRAKFAISSLATNTSESNRGECVLTLSCHEQQWTVSAPLDRGEEVVVSGAIDVLNGPKWGNEVYLEAFFNNVSNSSYAASVSEVSLSFEAQGHWCPAVEDVELAYRRLRDRFSLVYFWPHGELRVAESAGVGRELLDTTQMKRVSDAGSRAVVVLLDKSRNLGYLNWGKGEFFPSSLSIKEVNALGVRAGEQFLEVLKSDVDGLDGYHIIESGVDGGFSSVTLYE